MKVAIAASGLSHITRGMEGWSVDIAQGLYAKGVDVTLFKGSGEIINEYEKVLPTLKRNALFARLIGTITARGGWRIGLGSAPAIEAFVFGIQLLWHLRDGYDLLHIKQASLAAFLLRAKKRGLINIPIALSNGQIANEEFLSNFDYVQHLTPCLERIDSTDIDLETIPENRFVIPNFIDTDLFSPQDKRQSRQHLGLPHDAVIVLTAGAVKKYHKRMDYFIEEMSELKNTTNIPLHFVVAGARDTESRELMEMGYERLGDNISFLFDVPRGKMPVLYSAADVFVLCSLLEAFGTVLIEAMSCNIPVICHDHASFQWIVQDGGVHIDMAKKGALVDTLQDFLSHNTPGFDKIRSGRQRVIDKFSQDVVISQIMEMYETILNKRSISEKIS